MELCLKKQYFVQSCDRICQNRELRCNKCCDFLTKKKRPLKGASARRCYRWGSYVLVNSIKYRFKSQIVIDIAPVPPLLKMRNSAGFFVWDQTRRHNKDEQYD